MQITLISYILPLAPVGDCGRALCGGRVQLQRRPGAVPHPNGRWIRAILQVRERGREPPLRPSTPTILFRNPDLMGGLLLVSLGQVGRLAGSLKL